MPRSTNELFRVAIRGLRQAFARLLNLLFSEQPSSIFTALTMGCVTPD